MFEYSGDFLLTPVLRVYSSAQDVIGEQKELDIINE